MKTPTRFHCLNCGIATSLAKGNIDQPKCPECSGNLEQREEWTKWYDNEVAKWKKQMAKELVSKKNK